MMIRYWTVFFLCLLSSATITLADQAPDTDFIITVQGGYFLATDEMSEKIGNDPILISQETSRTIFKSQPDIWTGSGFSQATLVPLSLEIERSFPVIPVVKNRERGFSIPAYLSINLRGYWSRHIDQDAEPKDLALTMSASVGINLAAAAASEDVEVNEEEVENISVELHHAVVKPVQQIANMSDFENGRLLARHIGSIEEYIAALNRHLDVEIQTTDIPDYQIYGWFKVQPGDGHDDDWSW